MLRADHEDLLNVCLIEANPLARKYLLRILEGDSSLCVLGVEILLRKNSEPYAGTIFLLDNCGLPLPLSECLRRLRCGCAESKFIVLDRELTRKEILHLLHLGVDGYLAYDNVAESLLQAVRSVAQSKVWAPREVLRDFVQFSKATNRNTPASPDDITPREREIMELVKRRLSNKEIASLLRIRESTVKFHLSNVYSKLQVAGRSDLAEKNGNGPELGPLMRNLRPAES